MIRFLVVVFVGMTSAVQAQNIVFDISGTETCLAQAFVPKARSLCVGVSSQACMNANSLGGTTVGMGGCLDRERQYWDDRLNTAYRALRAREKSDDAANAGFAGHVSKANALRDMQRAWITFRDATCDYERAQWGGGTGGGPATLGCLMQLTGVQALYLEQRLAGF